MPAGVTIRRAETTEEIEAVRGLLVEYAQGLRVELSYEGFDEELAALPGAYGPPNGTLLLLKVGGQAAGCGGLRPLSPGVGEVKRIFVNAAYRGRGLGEVVVRSIISSARERGYHQLRLDTLPTMSVAARLYRKLGFREIPAYWPSPVPGTQYFELELRRDLESSPTRKSGRN